MKLADARRSSILWCRSPSSILIGAVRGAAPRHRARSRASSGRSWWSGSSRIALAGVLHISDDPRVFCRDQSASTRSSFSVEHGHIGLVTLGAVFLVGDRRRGALCRSRPFRPQADPVRLVRPGAAGAAAELFRAGRAGAAPIRRRSRIRSTGWFLICCCCRWSCWRPPPP